MKSRVVLQGAPAHRPESTERVVVGGEERLVAASHEDHEVSQVGASALDQRRREVGDPAALSGESASALVEVKALQILILNDFSFGASLAKEDVLHNV